jgi:hypothetical protein
MYLQVFAKHNFDYQLNIGHIILIFKHVMQIYIQMLSLSPLAPSF